MAGFLSSIGVVFAIVAGYFIHAAYSIEITVRGRRIPFFLRSGEMPIDWAARGPQNDSYPAVIPQRILPME